MRQNSSVKMVRSPYMHHLMMKKVCLGFVSQILEKVSNKRSKRKYSRNLVSWRERQTWTQMGLVLVYLSPSNWRKQMVDSCMYHLKVLIREHSSCSLWKWNLSNNSKRFSRTSKIIIRFCTLRVQWARYLPWVVDEVPWITSAHLHLRLWHQQVYLIMDQAVPHL